MTKYDKRNGPWYTPNGQVTPQDQILLDLIFDQSVTDDEFEYQEQLPQLQLLKKVCWIKTIIYPIELWLSYFLLGKLWYRERKEQQYYYAKARKGKICMEDFQEGLMDVTEKYLKLKGKVDA